MERGTDNELWFDLATLLDKQKPKRGRLKPAAPPTKPARNRSTERRTQAARMAAADAREAAWEIAMTERIRTESALIRAENDDHHHSNGCASKYNPRQPKIHGIGNLLPPGLDFS